ncbi:MAG: hypothetical protein GY727_15590 [Gammaproteobacteria bacterium]|nr:hypothetical protein [Gammaproteobacteria bacterium]
MFCVLMALFCNLIYAEQSKAAIGQADIIIVQKTVPDSGQNFDFELSSNISGVTNFTLDDDSGSIDVPSTKTFPVLGGAPLSVYTVSQTPVAGYNTTITCVGGNTTISGASVDIQLDGGETVTCTFTSRKLATIVVVQDTVPNAAQDFSFSIGGGLSPANFNLDDDSDGTLSNTRTYQYISPGEYILSQTLVNGYANSINCVGGTFIAGTDRTVNFGVDSGETITCTFTNTLMVGTIVVVEDSVPDADQDFYFSIDGGLSPASFTLDDDTDGTLSNSQTFNNVLVGAYNLAQQANADYSGSVSCVDPNGSVSNLDATIQLDQDETVTCTYTNVKIPTLTVVKTAINNDGGQLNVDDFTLRINGTPVTSGQANELEVGVEYTISEDEISGYALTGLSGDCAEDGTITLAAGQDATCTLTNDDQPVSITVIKDAGGNSSEQFDFTISAPPVWQVVGEVGFSAGGSGWTSMAFDSAGTPYVSYRDYENDEKLTVQKFNGTSWELVGPVAFTPEGVSYTSLAIDSNDTLYVAYGPNATVQKFNGSSWELVGSANFSEGSATYVSLAIDNSDTLYVGYGSYATVKKFNGSSWETVGSGGFSAGSVYYTDLAIDDNTDTPYIVYRSNSEGHKSIVQKFNGNSWELVGADGVSTARGLEQSIALDSTGTPYVSYTDFDKKFKATVYKYNGSSWELVGAEGFSPMASYLKLAIDSTDTPYVFYTDSDNNDLVVVERFNGSSWEQIGADSQSAEDVASISFAIDSADIPHLFYRDRVNGSRATVQKFDTIPVDFSTIGGGSTLFADLPADKYVIGENLSTGWQLDSASCTGGTDVGNLSGETLSVAVGNGEDVTCTFTNLKIPTLTVVKNVINDDGGQLTEADFGLFIDGAPVTNRQMYELEAGIQYTVSEAPTAGYALSGISGDCAADGTITLGAQQDATCILTNDDQPGSITIIKEAGGITSEQFDFTFGTPPVAFSITGGGSTTFATLPADDYSITENLTSGWQLDSASCTGGTDVGNLSGETLSVAVGNGEDVTCTFTNSYTPITRTVTNTNDSGAGSLRQIIADAVSGDAIVFDETTFPNYSDGTITLTSGELVIDKVLTITGGGRVTINANDTSRIFNIDDGTTSLVDVTLSGLVLTGGNANGTGGAILNKENLDLSNSTIANSTATTNGGGLYNDSGSQVTISNSTISGNTAQNGGGIYSDNGDSAAINNSTISGNTSSNSGGGLYLATNSNILNSTISGNTSGSFGSGIYLDRQRSLIANSTVVSNSGGYGIYVESTIFYLRSTIVANNLPGDADDGNSSSVIDAENSLIENSSGHNISNGVNGNIVGFDPMLFSLGDYGGSTEVHAIQDGSPVISAGINPQTLTLEQRGTGFPRVVDVIDIGAVEYMANVSLNVAKSGNGSGTVTGTPGNIDCGATCSENYYPDGSITIALAPDPATGSTFIGWSGACSGTGTCEVAMDQTRSVNALFNLNTYSLTVNNIGSGTGTVSSDPSGISCVGDCTETFDYNTSVTLTASPANGSTFSGWSEQSCPGTDSCTVTMDQARSITATFTLDSYTLSVATTGEGVVSSNPTGIDCGSDCQEDYDYNTSVTLTETPATGYVFDSWSGACSGTGTCNVTMDQARSVTAQFIVETHVLNVNKSGAGSGIVSSTPSGISCGSDCVETLDHNTYVTLTATPETGSVFSGWLGDCSGTGECGLTMDADHTASAIFGLENYTLTVTLEGSGSGEVTSVPAGIACGVTCVETFDYGTLLTLTAIPKGKSTFIGWSGACSGTAPCTVTMDEVIEVSARFDGSFPWAIILPTIIGNK